MLRTLFAVSLALAAAAMMAPSALAQSLWMPRDHESAVMLELLKPSFDGVDEEFASFSGFLGFRSAPKSKVSIVAEASIARLGYDDGFSQISSFSLGDIYVGMEYGPSAGPVFGELGVRLPTSSESEADARLTGVLSDVARWEAFLSKTISIQAAANYRRATTSGLYYRLRLSPTFAIPTENQFGGSDPELFAIYSGQLGMEMPAVRMGVGLVARTWISESDLSFSERTTTQLDAHVDFCSGSFRPGVDVKAPLDDELNDIVPVTVGVSFSYSH